MRNAYTKSLGSVFSRLLIAYIAMLLCLATKAQSQRIVLDDMQKEIVVNDIQCLRDSSCSLNFNQASTPSYLNKYTLSSAGNSGFNENIFCYWIKFELQNNSANNGEWLLDFEDWEKVEFYYTDSLARYSKKITGHLVPFKQRDFPLANRNLIAVGLYAGQSLACYVKLATGINYMLQPNKLSFKIYTKAAAFEYENTRRNWMFFFSGIYIVMFLYNLFLYFSIREKSYFYYLCLLILLFWTVWDNTGYAVQLFSNFETYPVWYSKIDLIASSVFGILIIQFTRSFLKIRENQRVINKLFTAIIISLIIVPIPGFFGYVLLATNISSLIGLITIGVILTAEIKSCLNKYPSAVIFLIAYSAFIIGVCLYLLTQMGVLPETRSTEFILQIGSSIEVVLFSFALSNSINILKKQNAEKQVQIIHQLEENTQLQSKVNRELEQKVEERTKEMKEFQKQLIQQEKLASLGELTAGVAHEIQNPMNFVNNFSEVSKEMLGELKEEIDQAHYEEVKHIANDIELNLEKIIFHGKRADSIVKGMLQHSRVNSGERTLTDINLLCDEYLRLAYQGLRAKDSSFNADIHKQLDPGIREIKVNAPDIGRVLLNMYNNALYAVDEKMKLQPDGYQPVVNVTTKAVGHDVEISIRDNGMGIPQKVIDKVFQPFFTTKPTGKGTGLGLSISYEIIKAHQGDIKINTEEGQFTEFIILLPYNKIA